MTAVGRSPHLERSRHLFGLRLGNGGKRAVLLFDCKPAFVLRLRKIIENLSGYVLVTYEKISIMETSKIFDNGRW
jgi:hypothetical protein